MQCLTFHSLHISCMYVYDAYVHVRVRLLGACKQKGSELSHVQHVGRQRRNLHRRRARFPSATSVFIEYSSERIERLAAATIIRRPQQARLPEPPPPNCRRNRASLQTGLSSIRRRPADTDPGGRQLAACLLSCCPTRKSQLTKEDSGEKPSPTAAATTALHSI